MKPDPDPANSSDSTSIDTTDPATLAIYFSLRLPSINLNLIVRVHQRIFDIIITSKRSCSFLFFSNANTEYDICPINVIRVPSCLKSTSRRHPYDAGTHPGSLSC